MFYYYQTIKKVNSYKERKTMKNEAAHQMLRKTGLVVRATEEKNLLRRMLLH